MSYSIIFQTKIVKLDDGRVIHFDRSGCNNDDVGRTKGEFTAKIYTLDEFIKRAESFKENSVPYKQADNFDIKIGSRYATYYDYGEHLLRMLKRAESFEDMKAHHAFRASYCKEIELTAPEHKTMTPEEFSEVFYKLLYGDKPFRYRCIMEHPDDKDEIISRIESGAPIEFYIS